MMSSERLPPIVEDIQDLINSIGEQRWKEARSKLLVLPESWLVDDSGRAIGVHFYLPLPQPLNNFSIVQPYMTSFMLAKMRRVNWFQRENHLIPNKDIAAMDGYALWKALKWLNRSRRVPTPA